MKSGLFLVLLGLAHAFPLEDDKSTYIDMTPERDEEIKKIGEEVTSFIQELADKHDEIDFALMKLEVENHSDDENEKATTLEIVVNDSKNTHFNPKIQDEYFEHDDSDSHRHREDDYKDINSEIVNISEPTENIENTMTNEQSINDLNAKRDEVNEIPHSTDNCELYSSISQSESKVKEESTLNENNDINRKKDDSGNGKLSPNENDSKIKENYLENEPSPKKEKCSKKNSDLSDLDASDNPEKVVEDSINKNYNFNGDYDNSKLIIYAPNYDYSKIEINSDNYYKNLYHALLEKINEEKKINNNIFENEDFHKQRFFNIPYNYENANLNENDDFYVNMKNVMVNRMKNDVRNDWYRFEPYGYVGNEFEEAFYDVNSGSNNGVYGSNYINDVIYR